MGPVVLCAVWYRNCSGLQRMTYTGTGEAYSTGRTLVLCVCTVQVVLMSEVARAGAAVDGHAGVAGVVDAGVAGVVEAWLGFLRNLALEEAYRVRCLTWGWWRLGAVLHHS